MWVEYKGSNFFFSRFSLLPPPLEMTGKIHLRWAADFPFVQDSKSPKFQNTSIKPKGNVNILLYTTFYSWEI